MEYKMQNVTELQNDFVREHEDKHTTEEIIMALKSLTSMYEYKQQLNYVKEILENNAKESSGGTSVEDFLDKFNKH